MDEKDVEFNYQGPGEVVSGIYAKNRHTLVDYFIGRTTLQLKDGSTITAVYPVVVKMPCGNCYRINKAIDWPYTNLACHCGNPNHWVLLYEEEMHDDS
jgi:hypothetical protein